MFNVVTKSAAETEALGQRIASVLNGREEIALFGDLGAGKTAFTRGVCKGIGIDEGVSSPTFALVNAYQGKYPVYHFDMYRITSIDDLFAVGFYDYIDTGILLIEWSENIESELEDDALRIRIQKSDDENERIFQIEGLDDYADIIC
jgi:tRNA threonylcarbamoyladenosine biosynthesis protein TsaE